MYVERYSRIGGRINSLAYLSAINLCPFYTIVMSQLSSLWDKVKNFVEKWWPYVVGIAVILFGLCLWKCSFCFNVVVIAGEISLGALFFILHYIELHRTIDELKSMNEVRRYYQLHQKDEKWWQAIPCLNRFQKVNKEFWKDDASIDEDSNNKCITLLHAIARIGCEESDLSFIKYLVHIYSGLEDIPSFKNPLSFAVDERTVKIFYEAGIQCTKDEFFDVLFEHWRLWVSVEPQKNNVIRALFNYYASPEIVQYILRNEKYYGRAWNFFEMMKGISNGHVDVNEVDIFDFTPLYILLRSFYATDVGKRKNETVFHRYGRNFFWQFKYLDLLIPKISHLDERSSSVVYEMQKYGDEYREILQRLNTLITLTVPS
jgi:hypothetical protein